MLEIPHRFTTLLLSYFIFPKTGNLYLEWTVVRTADLVDGLSSKYEFLDKPQNPFLAEMASTRANIAKSMCDVLLIEKLWEEWKFK